MAEVRPLRGVRFDRRFSGPIGPLLAPPYDVVDPANRSGGFGIGLIENVRVGAAGDQHALSAARYRDWRKRGILRRDALPAIYLHRHSFNHAGSEIVRTGLIARVRLTDWSKRVVLPHERTTIGPRAERLERLRCVGANLSPLYLLFRDPTGEVRALISDDRARDMPFGDRDLMGGGHSLTALTAPELHHRVGQLFQNRTLFMADGHHRYEAALAYRDERRRSAGPERNDESEFVMVLLAAVEDEGVRIRPIHRLVEAGNGLSVQALVDLLRRWFTLRPAREPFEQWSSEIVFRVVLAQGRGTWDVLRRPGDPHVALMPAEQGYAWRTLPVASFQVAMQEAFGARYEDGMAGIQLILDAEDATRRVQRDEALAAFLLPTPELDHVLEVAEEGDLMPAKSTWFEPKAPAGLVINELRCQAP